VDTFEGEPAPRVTLLQAADLVTPHIAGHSIAGKLRVAHRAVDSLRQALHLPAIGPLESAVDGAVTALSDRELGVFAALDDACRSLQDVPGDFEAIRHRHRRLELFLRSA
jgi:erythronate-4-phosphate dehydrogenase